MPLDHPDYGAHETAVAYPLMLDLGELAVRLGSIDIFDRRGTVICLDDFESPQLKWYPSTIMDGAVILDTTYPKSGSQNVKLSTGAVATGSGQIDRGFVPLQSMRIGSEISFYAPSTLTTFHCAIVNYDGVNYAIAEIKFDFATKKVYYLDENNAYVEKAELLGFISRATIYHPVKLVVDLDDLEYVRLIYGDTEYDLSDISLYSVADTTLPYFLARYRCVYASGAGSSIYLDDFILTMDEP